ncbi:interleukin 10 [Penguinpox virus]|uniref:Viral interleukin-10 homolog n=1 Tax=Penguinpox virus TaxID=648998 RepID=A0A068EGM0_9POXV|nr:interleukin 10 [Penguinpox virus]AID46755.1 interleukin 10 [Penguinpox virus]
MECLRFIVLIVAIFPINILANKISSDTNSCDHKKRHRIPSLIKELDGKFKEVKDYFQSRDHDLSTMLLIDLTSTLKGPCGCRTLDKLLTRYMLVTSNTIPYIPQDMESKVHDIVNCLNSLQHIMEECYYICRGYDTPINNINNYYSKMGVNATNKVMGEFDILLDGIRDLLANV